MRRLILGLGVLSLAVVAGCATERPTRSFVQPNYVSKDVFKGVWYFRQTVTDVPSTTGFTFTGETGSTFKAEKIRWEIQEKFLIAYRSYELVPGTDNQADQENKGPDGTRFAEGQAEGRTDGFREQPIAAYPIESHFDIFRQYNSTTGEEINVLEENTKDNPWYARKYIRVDWSKNSVVNFEFLTTKIDWSSPTYATTNHNGMWYVQDSEGGRDKFRVEYRKDAQGKDQAYYLDFVTRIFVDPNIYGCFLTPTYYAEDCTAAEMSIRSSFLKVDEREFEPVTYDDRKMSKFGYFRTERLTYNRVRGITQSGRIYLANVHNLFGKVYQRDGAGNKLFSDKDGRRVFYTEAEGYHYRVGDLEAGAPERDGAGKLVAPNAVNPLYLPKEMRPLKPVVYHLSPRYPQAMIHAAEKVADSWNHAFRRAAAAAQNRNVDDGSFTTMTACETAHGQGQCGDNGAGGYCNQGNQCTPIPDMFVLNYNGWVKNVDGFGNVDFTDYGSVRDADHNQSGRNITWRYDTTKEVAQIGDLRYSHMYWVHHPQVAGPLGYGPSAGDAETGEIISGTAYVYGAAVDTYASYALDIIRTINGQMSIDELITGSTVADYISRNLDATDPRQRRQRMSAELMSTPIAQVKAKLLGPKKMAKLNLVRQYGLEPARHGREAEFMRRLKESGLVNLLVNDEVKIARSRGLYRPGQPLPADVEAKLIDVESWATPKALLARINGRRGLATRHNLMLADFAEDAVAGLALKYASLPAADLVDGGKVWQELREKIFQGVMEHEVGHTLGLRHNFQGSFDAVNYKDDYWQLRKENLRPASQIQYFSDLFDMAAQTTNQKNGSMHEFAYSSIMDYGARFNSDVRGIGKYDEAAIMFAYGNAVEVFDVDRGQIDSETQDEIDFSANKPSPVYDSFTERVHYTQVPYRMGNGNLEAGIQNLKKRRIVNWDQLQAARAAGQANLPIEVPYMFCSDDWVGAIGSCQLWDTGADHNEIVQDLMLRYKNYYFFNNFKRDRVHFSADDVLNRVFGRYLSYMPNLYQHWLFSQFYTQSLDGLGDIYWTIATFDGLNQISDVLTKPEYGSFELDSANNLYTWRSYSQGNGSVYIPRGEGRRTYSRYDLDSGYYLFDRTLESGHFWDYLAGILAISQTEATVVGVETVSDFTTYIIPYYLVFEEEVTRIINGVFAKDHNAIAPRINGSGQVVMYPAVELNGVTTAPQGTPIELDINFTKQVYAMLYGMAFFTSNYSLHFPDQAQIFRLGAGEAVTAGDGYELIQFTDPQTGHQYGSLKQTGVAPSTLAAKLVVKGQGLAAQYSALAATNPAPDSSQGQQLQSLGYELSDLVTDMNLLRSLYAEFSRVF